MKIAWFSPLPPLKSGISEYSEVILEHLIDHASVDLWVDGFSPRPDFYKKFKIINYKGRTEILPILKSYDAIIYNMGNNIEFHGGIYDVFEEYPGIVILHDYVLHHFFANYWLIKKNDREGYFTEVRRQYGQDAEEIARKSLSRPKNPLWWETEVVIKYPLNMSILEKAKLTVVHSEFAKKLIQDAVNAKVCKINTPVYPLPKQISSKTRKDLGLPDNKIILLSLGFLHPMKRLHILFDVVSKDTYLKNNLYFVVIGESVHPKYQLDEYVAKIGLSSHVKFLGYLPIEDIYTYLNCSDICVNLRYPTMGETSGSIIRIMSMGKPVLVSDIGWYGELPDDCVIKIDPLKEVDKINSFLKRIIDDNSLFGDIGIAGKTYIEENFSPQTFVSKLIEAIENANNISQDFVYYKMINTITDFELDLNFNHESFKEQIARQLIWCK